MNRRTLAFAALGTTALVTVADPARLRAAGALLHDELDLVDRACNRFRPDSELQAVNAAAGTPVGVSGVLYAAVDAAVHAAAASGGAVRPTEQPASLRLELVGHGPRGAPRVRFRPAPAWHRVALDPARHTIRLPAGVALDLDATGLAFAADRAAQRIADETATGVLVNVGGAVALAGEAPAEGWPVRLSGHLLAPTDGPVVALRDGGLATATSAGSGDWRMASVTAASCVDATAASRAALALGSRAPAWLEDLGLAARLVARDGGVVTTAGWPHDR